MNGFWHWFVVALIVWFIACALNRVNPFTVIFGNGRSARRVAPVPAQPRQTLEVAAPHPVKRHLPPDPTPAAIRTLLNTVSRN